MAVPVLVYDDACMLDFITSVMDGRVFSERSGCFLLLTR
jgi:hypothetical protein